MPGAVIDRLSKINSRGKNWSSWYTFTAMLLLGGLMETAPNDLIAVDGFEVDSRNSSRFSDEGGCGGVCGVDGG